MPSGIGATAERGGRRPALAGTAAGGGGPVGCLADKEMEPEALRAITDKLDGQELETLKKTYARRAGDRFPLKTQLEYGETWAEKRDQDGAFLI